MKIRHIPTLHLSEQGTLEKSYKDIYLQNIYTFIQLRKILAPLNQHTSVTAQCADSVTKLQHDKRGGAIKGLT